MAKVSKEQSKAISLSKIDLDPNGDRLEMDEEELKSLALNIWLMVFWGAKRSDALLRFALIARSLF